MKDLGINIELAASVINNNYDQLFAPLNGSSSTNGTGKVTQNQKRDTVTQTNNSNANQTINYFKHGHDAILANILDMLDHPNSLDINKLEALIAARELLSYAMTNPEVAEQIVNLSDDEQGKEIIPSKKDFGHLIALKENHQKARQGLQPFKAVVQLDDQRSDSYFIGLSHADVVGGVLQSKYFSHRLAFDVANNTYYKPTPQSKGKELSVSSYLKYIKEAVKQGKEFGAIVIPRGINNQEYQNILQEIGMKGQVTGYNTQQMLPKMIEKMGQRIPNLEKELGLININQFNDISRVQNALMMKKKEKASLTGSGQSVAIIERDIASLEKQYKTFSPPLVRDFENYDIKATNLVLMKEVVNVYKEVDELMALEKQGRKVPPVIVSSGNDAANNPDYVNLYACHDAMLVVGASADKQRSRDAQFAGKGNNVDIREYSQVSLNNGQKYVDGTSFSAPMLAEDFAWMVEMGIPVKSNNPYQQDINTLVRQNDFHQKWYQFKQKASLDDLLAAGSKEEQKMIFSKQRALFDQVFSSPETSGVQKTIALQEEESKLQKVWTKGQQIVSHAVDNGKDILGISGKNSISRGDGNSHDRSIRNVSKYYGS